MVHAGVGGLDCPAVPQAVIEGDPRLQRGERCSIDLEPRTVKSDVGAEPIGEVHLILDVEELFRRPHLLCPKRRVDAREILAKFRLERRGPRIEPVQGQVATEAQVVRVVERIIEVHACRVIHDAASVQTVKPLGRGVAGRIFRF